MPSRADVQAFQQTTAHVGTLAGADLTRFWAGVDTANITATRDAVTGYLPTLVQAYGETAALVAANHYDQLREDSGATGAFQAVLADPANTEQAAAAARWAIGPVLTGAVAQALEQLRQVTRRLVLQPARQTIAHNAAHDPSRPGWARVPTGRETCAFCLMLASRGAVYGTAASAGRMNQYHSDCDCTPTPIWGEYPQGYDPDALYAKYQAAVRDAPKASTSSTLATLRQQQHIS